MRTPLLSIVVASVEASRTLGEALHALCAASADLEIELWVVDASRDGSAELAHAFGRPAQVVEREPGTLAPILWAEGIRRSTGDIVALTTGHCVVPPRWARALVGALGEGVGAAGAGLVPLPTASAVDRAVCYLRYSGFLHTTQGDPRPADELPGDNAAYHGPSLREYVAKHPEGFWEIEYHHLLRGRGEHLLAVPAATAGFGRSFPFGTIFRHRFEHGRRFGAWRVGKRGEPVMRVVAPAPLVPFALAIRAANRTFRIRGHRGAFATSAAPFLALAASWAAGEALGALQGPR